MTIFKVDCSRYTTGSDSEFLCHWNVGQMLGTWILDSVLVVSLLALVLLKINRKSNRYVVIFSFMLAASLTLEFFSLYPGTNYALIWFDVRSPSQCLITLLSTSIGLLL